MTRYTVLWDSAVESQFIEAWVASDSQTRETLTEIANWIDSQLKTDAHAKGEQISDLPVRVLLVPVSQARVSAIFQVLPEERQVRVIRIVFRR